MPANAASADRGDVLAGLTSSERALLDALDDLTDADAAAPSTLPGWSRGHVLTHLARNAETLTWVLDGAARGEVRTMYGGSLASRTADIEAGADRPATLLRADVERTATDLLDRLNALDDAGWAGQVGHPRRPDPVPVTELPLMRWQEVEVHRLDLDLGYRPQDWPAAYVEAVLPVQLARLPQRAPGVAVPELPPHDLLAWLYGRGVPGYDDLPELPPWP